MAERYYLAPGARIRPDPVRGGQVLLLPEKAVFLNETAAEILSLCTGQDLAGILAELNQRYPGEDLEADVREFLTEALGRGWICQQT